MSGVQDRALLGPLLTKPAHGQSGLGGWVGCRVENDPAQPHGTALLRGSRVPWARVRWVMPLPRSLWGGRAGPPSQSGTLMGGCCPGHQASKQGLETWAGVCVKEPRNPVDKMTTPRWPHKVTEGKNADVAWARWWDLGQVRCFPLSSAGLDDISYSEAENFLKSLRRIPFGSSP